MNSFYFFFTFPLPPHFLIFGNEHRFTIRKKCYKITCCNLQGGPPPLFWHGLYWLILADLGGLLQSDGTKSAAGLAKPAGDMGLLHHSPWLSFLWRIYFFSPLILTKQSVGWNCNPRLLEKDEGQVPRDSDPHRPCLGIRVLLLRWEGCGESMLPTLWLHDLLTPETSSEIVFAHPTNEKAVAEGKACSHDWLRMDAKRCLLA